MTQLEKILKHFVNLAEYAISIGGYDDYNSELQDLVDGIQIRDIKPASLIEDFDKYHGYFRDGWNYSDIIYRAEQDDILLTNEEVLKIAEHLNESYDANNGINWDVIADAITYITNTEE